MNELSLDKDVERILVTEEEAKAICKRLGEQISKDYEGKRLLLVSVLKGAVVFMADLMRSITCDCQIDFMAVSSYSGTKTTGVVKFKKDLDIDPDGCDILLVEDILDSGVTLAYLKNVLMDRNAASIKVCAFLDKPANRRADIQADYVGKVIPDEFVIGYGLDHLRSTPTNRKGALTLEQEFEKCAFVFRNPHCVHNRGAFGFLSFKNHG